MMPARSLAATVAALGFASAMTAPQPAFAAPAPCTQAENYAAQSGAELLRIAKLEVHTATAERTRAKSDRAGEKAGEGRVDDAANRVLASAANSPIPDPEDSDTLSEGIGMIGTGVLGQLGVRPKATTAPSGKPEVAPSAKRGAIVGHPTEQGEVALNGVAGSTDSSGAGGGEPIGEDAGSGKTDSDANDDEATSGGDDDSDRPTDSDHPAGSGSGVSPRGVDSGDDGDSDSGAGAGNGETTRAIMSEVGVGEARTAMIGSARIASAAYARMLDGRLGDQASASQKAMAKPLLQQAPPTNAKAARRTTPSGKVGPLRLGRGEIAAHAQWDAEMACGHSAGRTGRADAELTSLNVLDNGNGALIRVPGRMTGYGTTALERQGGEPRTVAKSTVAAGRIELASGKVRVRILRAPTLEAAMSANAGGKVNYSPAVVEISGDGIPTKRLDAAGEHVDLSLTPRQHATESASLTDLGGLREAEPLPVPAVPGLPPVATPEPESTLAATQGIKVRIALGDVRHAVKGHAIAAKASAIKVSLTLTTASKTRGQDGYGDTSRSSVSVNAAFGILEAAAVSPEQPQVAAEGAGGGLPVTGPRLDRIAMVGGAFLLLGIAAVLISCRRRSQP